jgi:hypothetical protein
MHPEIEELLRLTGLGSWQTKIESIAIELKIDYSKALSELIELDKNIPGLGQHNVNKQVDKDTLTGVYDIEDRPIFRGIQYFGMHLNPEHPEWYTRMLVSDCCLHVENSLKRKTGIRGRLSIGMILDKITRGIAIDNSTFDSLRLLNRAVYNKSKHTIEKIDMDSHMFSIEDAIAIYFICRTLGASLLKGLGLVTEKGLIIFP